MNCNSFLYSQHALIKMFARSITITEVENVITSGQVIANYPTDTPYPSCLILDFIGNRPIHVVVAQNPQGDCVVITAYEPDAMLWNPDFKTKI